MRSPLGSADRGSVTAEFAVLLPALLLVLALCLGAIRLVGLQLQLSDAAADAARAAARGDDPARVAALVSSAVLGANLSLSTRGEFVCAELGSVPAGGLVSFGVRLTASSCALAGGL